MGRAVSMRRAWRLGWRVAGLTLLAGALPAAADPAAGPAPAATAGWAQARQLILVVTPDWNADHGSLQTFVRDGQGWRAAGLAAPVTIGHAGAAWGRGLQPEAGEGPRKREGDGRSPAGVFRLGIAFGYAAGATTAMPYRALTAGDYCIDVSGSPLYNRIVDAAKVGEAAVKGSTEPMRRDLHVHGDQRYKLGFVIAHNADARAQAGSCIFGHLWKSPHDATTGCTAMAEATMRALLAWLRPDEQPVFVLLPRQAYARLAASWQLPRLAAP